MKTTLATMPTDCDAPSLPLPLGSECGAQCRALPARLAEPRPASGLAFWPAARRVTARRSPGVRGAGGGLSLLLAAGLAGSASAATYYVDATHGDDVRSAAQAQNIATPWRTIQKAASMMAAGDTALIRAGTYRETVTPQSGQTFQAYQNEKPLITGCDPVSGWTVHAGSIYKATVTTKVYDVFVGTNYMHKARWPNFNGDYQSDATWTSTTNWLVSSSGTGRGGARFTAATPPSCVGGWYSGLHGGNPFMASEGRISAQSGDEITCTNLSPGWIGTYGQMVGTGTGYVTDHLNCLDAEQEWHWQSNVLYFWAPGSGVPTNVQARTRLYGFVLSNRSNVTLQGLYFLGASVQISGGSNNTIDGCHFRQVSPWGNHRYTDARQVFWGGTVDGTSGIHLSGTNHAVRNSSVVGGWGHGIHFSGGDRLTVSNNYVADFVWAGRFVHAPISGYGSNLFLLNNTVRRSAGAGIFLYQKNPGDGSNVNHVRRPAIKYNDIRDCGYLLTDSGHAFIYIQNADVPGEERWLDGEIAYNLLVGIHKIREQVGGIYLDNGTDFCTIHHNVVNMLPGMTRAGINLHGAGHLQENIFCYHNVLWGYKNGGWGAAISSNSGDSTAGRTNLVFRNNLAQYTKYAGINWDTPSWTTQGMTISHNRTNVPASEFVDVVNSNFRLNSTATASIDDGIVIAGINDAGSASPYVGSAPDLGAYEYGGVDWTAGATVTPPVFPDFNEVAIPVPAAPSGLTATAVSSSQINLSWTDNATNEMGFVIERKTGVGGTWAQIATLGANATGCSNSGLAAGTTYYYRVAATNSAGASAWSNEANATTFALTPPAAPSSLAATAVSSTRINLGWTDNATDETGFVIQRKTGSGGSWTQIATLGANATSYSNTGLTPNTTYAYRVAATNSAGASGWSNEAEATTPAGEAACLPQTGQTVSSVAGDDGDLQKGVAWPSPRFTDHGNGTVSDNLTGLIWLKNASAPGVQTWTNALNWCQGLSNGVAGLSDGSVAGDWRLPNLNELRSLVGLGSVPTVPGGHPFVGVQTGASYWSGTARPGGSTVLTVNFNSGNSGSAAKGSSLQVWAVKGSGCVARTGQWVSQGPGDDGARQEGVGWPSPRFTDHGDGTVTDHLTGLVWTKNANPLGNLDWTNAVGACRTLASGMYGLSDGSVAGEWRLPNVNELRSLVDYGGGGAPYLPVGHPFVGVGNNYWTSSRRGDVGGGYLVDFGNGGVGDVAVTESYGVWPVRDVGAALPVAAQFTGWAWQPDGGLLLSATGGLSQTYILQGATNLTPPVVWQAIVTNTASGGAVQFLDTSATNHPQRYYRAVTP